MNRGHAASASSSSDSIDDVTGRSRAAGGKENAFRGKCIATSGFTSQQNAEARAIIESFGGTFQKRVLDEDDNPVDVLVAFTRNTAKCRTATERSIPVVNHKWLSECRAKETSLPLQPYLLEPLGGINISITGFSEPTPAKRDEISKTATALGANFKFALDMSCNILICEKPSGPKFEFAKQNSIAIVSDEWLWESKKLRYAADTNPFLLFVPKDSQQQSSADSNGSSSSSAGNPMQKPLKTSPSAKAKQLAKQQAAEEEARQRQRLKEQEEEDEAQKELELAQERERRDREARDRERSYPPPLQYEIGNDSDEEANSSWLEGGKLFFYGMTDKEQQEGKRIADRGGGVVQPIWHHAIAHYICGTNLRFDEKVAMQDLRKTKKVDFLRFEWLVACDSKGKCLPTAPYILDPSEYLVNSPAPSPVPRPGSANPSHVIIKPQPQKPTSAGSSSSSSSASFVAPSSSSSRPGSALSDIISDVSDDEFQSGAGQSRNRNSSSSSSALSLSSSSSSSKRKPATGLAAAKLKPEPLPLGTVPAFFGSSSSSAAPSPAFSASVAPDRKGLIFLGALFRVLSSVGGVNREITEEKIKAQGGLIFKHGNHATPRYIVAPHGDARSNTPTPGSASSSNAPISLYVTMEWVEACVRDHILLNPQSHILFTPARPGLAPMPKHSAHMASKTLVCATGFCPSKRYLIGRMIELLGGKYSDRMSRTETSHLVCEKGSDSSEKVGKARLWGIPLATEDWLIESFKSGCFISYLNYKFVPNAQSDAASSSSSSSFSSAMSVSRSVFSPNENINHVGPSPTPSASPSPISHAQDNNSYDIRNNGFISPPPLMPPPAPPAPPAPLPSSADDGNDFAFPPMEISNSNDSNSHRPASVVSSAVISPAAVQAPLFSATVHAPVASNLPSSSSLAHPHDSSSAFRSPKKPTISSANKLISSEESPSASSAKLFDPASKMLLEMVQTLSSSSSPVVGRSSNSSSHSILPLASATRSSLLSKSITTSVSAFSSSSSSSASARVKLSDLSADLSFVPRGNNNSNNNNHQHHHSAASAAAESVAAPAASSEKLFAINNHNAGPRPDSESVSSSSVSSPMMPSDDGISPMSDESEYDVQVSQTQYSYGREEDRTMVIQQAKSRLQKQAEKRTLVAEGQKEKKSSKRQK